jgi:signal transduction histidine kinase
VQVLSHQLHPSRIEILGIVEGLRSFCREFAEQKNVEVSFQTKDVPHRVPSSISLSLFRIVQEALHNSAKHSGVRQFDVRLWGADGRIHVAVSDRGVGFDAQAPKGSRGIGLITMKERVKLVQGELSIESQPGHGTTIRAGVPFPAA